MRLSCVQALFQGVYPSSAEGKGNAGDAALRTPQPVFLQHNDGGNQGCIGCRGIRGIQKTEVGRNGGKCKITELGLVLWLEFVYDG